MTFMLVGFTIINVYLPSCSSDNEDIFREELRKVKSFYDSTDTPNVCLIGDFNASDSNKNGQILRDFCLDNDMILSDKELLPNDSFTYVSDAHHSCT